MRATIAGTTGDKSGASAERTAIHNKAPERGEYAEKYKELAGGMSRVLGLWCLVLLLYILMRKEGAEEKLSLETFCQPITNCL